MLKRVPLLAALAASAIMALSLASASAQSADPAPSTGPSPSAAPAPVSGTVYVGELEGVYGFVALHVDEPDASGQRTVRAYVCDGKPIDDGGFALWFKGQAGDGELSLTAPRSTAALTFTLGETVTGSVALADGRTATFDAPVATNGSGIYEVTVGADGSYIGRSTLGDALDGTIDVDEDGFPEVTGTLTPTGGQPLPFWAKSAEREPFAVDSFVAVALVHEPDADAMAEYQGAYYVDMAGRSGDVRGGEPGRNVINIPY